MARKLFIPGPIDVMPDVLENGDANDWSPRKGCECFTRKR